MRKLANQGITTKINFYLLSERVIIKLRTGNAESYFEKERKKEKDDYV